MTVLLLLVVAFLAYSNGSNDNFKGVASIYGSETTSYSKALAWATVTTMAGSLAAIFLAEKLLKQFTGSGLVPQNVITPAFLIAVATGAGVTVILATRFGFPVSTTHGLTGAMLGAGLLAAGSKVNFAMLGTKFFLPLLLSPILAIAVGSLLYGVLRMLRQKSGIGEDSCACVGVETQSACAPAFSPAAALVAAPVLSAAVDKQQVCEDRYAGNLLGFNCEKILDSAHFLSAGVLSFARGLNDTPKIAALLLVLKAFRVEYSMILVAMAMAIGGLIHSRRIAEKMSFQITRLNHGQGFCSNFTSGFLVILASRYGLPVSTTHVTVGSLLGIGLFTRTANLKTMGGIALSWLITLPCAAAMGALVYWMAA